MAQRAGREAAVPEPAEVQGSFSGWWEYLKVDVKEGHTRSESKYQSLTLSDI